MDERSLRTALQGLNLPALHYLESIPSTNDLALQLAAEGALDDTLVAAGQQTAGRGRLERRWISKPGGSLAFSLVLRPTPQESAHLTLFPALCGLAVCQALEGLGLLPQIKWPNDVLLDGRKTCGVLVEAVWQGRCLQGLVAGIGVNVAPSSLPPDLEVMFPATCVEAALGRPVQPERLLAQIITALRAGRPGLGSPKFLAAWESRLAFVGQAVRLEGPGVQWEGRLSGVAPDGSLRLLNSEGSEMHVQAGDLRLRPV